MIMRLFCRWKGHKWRKASVGSLSPSLGAIVGNIKTCERCGKEEKWLSTVNTYPLSQPLKLDNETNE